MKKGSKLYSVLRRKCPSCHEGDFFISHPYNLKSMGDIYESCELCKHTFNPEPGFYFGAMYISYAIGVALLVFVWVVLAIFNIKIDIISRIISISVLWISLAPLIHSLSKIIWANLFMSYNAEKNNEDF